MDLIANIIGKLNKNLKKQLPWSVVVVSIVFLTGCSTSLTQPVQTPFAAAESNVLETMTMNPKDLQAEGLPTERVTDTPYPFTETPVSGQTDASEATATPCAASLTSTNQEGPYYTPGSPEKTSLIEPGMQGEPVLIQGTVLNEACEPIAGARVDFWQADAEGNYDNTGYRLRGHVLTDENGLYAVVTIVPGPYTGRPPHIHVKVFAPDGGELLTTQLYFPGSEASGDVQSAPDLLVHYQGVDGLGHQQVRFDFVVQW